MDRKDNRAYLQDMLDNARFVHGYSRDFTLDDVRERTDVRFVIERGLQNIGEAAFQLKRIAPETLEGITEHERIIGMRHILVHGYDQVKPDVLWQVASTKLDTLISDIQTAMARLTENTP